MKKIIVITGDLAAGKSTVADYLSEKLHILAIKKDTVKERLCDVIGFTNREENRKLSLAAVSYMINTFESSVKAGTDLILEANFRLDELNKIKDIAKSNGYKMLTFNLTGDIDVLFRRFCDRIPTRHKAHMSMKLNEDINKFEEYIQSIRDEIASFKDAIKIEINNMTSEEIANKCISIIEGE